MRGPILVATLLLLFLPRLAEADILHLKNGRSLEGKVVSERGGVIGLEVQGGVVRVPRASVARIERRASAHDEYTERLKGTPLDDPEAVDALALWASARGLGDQARELRRIADGQRLEARVLAARQRKDAGAFVGTFRWARQRGFGVAVQRYLLQQALELDPQHGPARSELERLPLPTPASPEEVEEAEEAAEASSEEGPGAGPPDRVTELERRLAEQRGEAEELRKRLQELEQRQESQARRDRIERRRLRRTRLAGGGGVFIGPYRVDSPQLDGPTGPQGPCPRRPACPPPPPPLRSTLRPTLRR